MFKKIEKDLDNLQDIDEEVEESTDKVEKEEQNEKVKPKEATVSDILMNHEQRLVEMEAKWFRLGGI